MTQIGSVTNHKLIFITNNVWFGGVVQSGLEGCFQSGLEGCSVWFGGLFTADVF
jgi:hypothetical protein